MDTITKAIEYVISNEAGELYPQMLDQESTILAVLKNHKNIPQASQKMARKALIDFGTLTANARKLRHDFMISGYEFNLHAHYVFAQGIDPEHILDTPTSLMYQMQTAAFLAIRIKILFALLFALRRDAFPEFEPCVLRHLAALDVVIASFCEKAHLRNLQPIDFTQLIPSIPATSSSKEENLCDLDVWEFEFVNPPTNAIHRGLISSKHESRSFRVSKHEKIILQYTVDPTAPRLSYDQVKSKQTDVGLALLLREQKEEETAATSDEDDDDDDDEEPPVASQAKRRKLCDQDDEDCDDDNEEPELV